MNNGQPPFVRFPKELYDAALRCGMPATHLKVFLTVVRLSYGKRNRRCATVSVGAIQKSTGHARSAVKVALADLVAKGVLIEEASPSFTLGRVLSVQEDYETWRTPYNVSAGDVPLFLREDWEGLQSEQGHESEHPGPAERPEQGQQSEHTLKTEVGDYVPHTPSNSGGGARAGGAPRKGKSKSQGKAAPGSHSSMTDGADDPGRSWLYDDEFPDAEVPA